MVTQGRTISWAVSYGPEL